MARHLITTTLRHCRNVQASGLEEGHMLQRSCANLRELDSLIGPLLDAITTDDTTRAYNEVDTLIDLYRMKRQQAAD